MESSKIFNYKILCDYFLNRCDEFFEYYGLFLNKKDNIDVGISDINILIDISNLDESVLNTFVSLIDDFKKYVFGGVFNLNKIFINFEYGCESYYNMKEVCIIATIGFSPDDDNLLDKYKKGEKENE